MIKFYDSSGTVHFGQATITRKTSVNGGLSLTGEVFAGDDVLNGLDYGWWLNFDNEKYVITYKKLSDDTNTVVFDAVQQFFWDFAKVALHAQYTGSHEYTFYLGQLFDKSGYTYKNDVTVPAFEKENWGYKNKLDLFNDIMDQAGVEFEVHNETVHIAKQIGSDLTSFARKGINLSDLTEEMKISDFATYAKGYGAFKDAEDQSKGRLEVEYRSELAKQFGDLEMDPIVDERYTIADNLIAALKKQVDATYAVSMTMNIYDLENAGYPNYEAPKVGDWILAIDEALNFKRKIRIIQLEEQFDVTSKRIGYTATCGDLSIVDQYTHLQSSLDSKVQRIQESVDNALSSANGKSTNYYGEKEPTSANEGDLWFDQSDSDPDKWSIKQWVNGRWEQITLNPGEVDAKVDVAKKEAETAVENAKSASDKADQLAAKYDDTNALAHQALDRSVSAQSDASSAVVEANSAASEFGKVDQKADSAVASALGAQNDASAAVKQASSAAADSKDAKQIAGAVSQSYKTLTDGSTMTIAELESGLAAKLTKTDLDGYATQTWTQNQIKVTADGINGTMSSIKSTVDSQTTSINDLKADSSSFKSQFTTVNNTLGKQSTDIGNLQATSKELSSNFSSLNADNNTNKNDISQLKQTATEVSSTLETVKTQVQNSAVGTNLLTNTGDLSANWTLGGNVDTSQNPAVLHYPTTTLTSSSSSAIAQQQLNDGLLQPSTTYTASFYAKGAGTFRFYCYPGVSDGAHQDNLTFIKLTSDYKLYAITFTTVSNLSGSKYFSLRQDYTPSDPDENTVEAYVYGLKLEKGSVATDWCPNPADNATVTALSKLSQTVDGMKIDISKKIEQKDLNGYATQTWAQNKINTTADGINGTLSSVKTTVDGHETSINDLKADSSSFKTQFTTVNGTLGKHTTDIGTLQASSKSLSANFDSLSSDNKTNQHDIGQLKASAETFNSTLMTVQQQVTDSAVGTNLLTNTSDLSANWWVTGNIDTSQKPAVLHYLMTTLTSSANILANQQLNDGLLKPSTTYTASFYAKGTGTFIFYCYPGVSSGEHSDSRTEIKLTSEYKLYAITFTTFPDISGNKNFLLRQDYSDSDPDQNTVEAYVYGFKLEKGSMATDWCLNPVDTATVTAVSSISQTVEHIQTTVSGKVDGETYRSDMNELNNQITAKVSQGDITNENILPYSGYWSDLTGWALMDWGASDKTLNLAHHNFYHNAVDATLYIGTAMDKTAAVGSTKFNVMPNTTYTFTFLGFASSNVKGINVYVLGRSYTSTKDYEYVHDVQTDLIMSPNEIKKYTATFTTNSDETQAYVRLDNQGSTNGQSSGAYFAELKIERGTVSTPYTRVSSGEIQVTSDNINLKVSKDGVVNAINISKEGTSIYGNKLRITAATYIDNAVIKDAMIADLSASKLTAGSINAATINVYNINGSNIVANSISADKLQAGSMLIAMNSTLQTLKLGTDGLYTTNNSGTFIGKIHANNLIEHPGDWGLHFDLSSNAQYMAWGAQNENDPNGGYVVKFGWTRNSSAGDFTMPWGGFWFNDNVMLHKNLRFNGGGIDVDGAYQLMKFAWISMNGIKYPFFGSSNLKAGWLFGSSETYLVRDGGIINASKILGILNGQHYKFIKDLNSNGTVKGYVDVNF
ncbi:phage tail protein [Lactiplantibacillus plantarum]|uniref:phage tail protein n=1 Tax=Lactiplantibacillus plantarum TaxID=1590 RepID=UPI003C2428FD